MWRITILLVATILHSNRGSRFWKSLIHVALLVLKHAKMVIHYGVATNTLAESRALRDGLAMCKEHGWLDFVVESDSTLIVKQA